MLCVHTVSIDHYSLASAWMHAKPRFSILAWQITSALNRREKKSEFLFFFTMWKCCLLYCQVFHTVLCFLFELLLHCSSNFLLLSECQSEMTVVLCQTTYTPDGNPFAFHLKLISFVVTMLVTRWTSLCLHWDHSYLLCVSDVQALTNNLWDSTWYFYSVWHSFLYGCFPLTKLFIFLFNLLRCISPSTPSKIGRNLQSSGIYQSPCWNLGLYIKLSDECLLFCLPSALDIEMFLQSMT